MMTPPRSGAVRVVIGARTDRGRRRDENEDDFLVADLTVPAGDGGLLLVGRNGDERPGPFRVTLGPRGALFLVADGMGGGVAGGLASRLATRRIHEEVGREWGSAAELGLPRFAASLRRAVESANDHLFRHCIENPECQGMGTTATVAGIVDDVLIVAQVGDSRAYLMREGAVVQLTRDQSVVQAMVEAGTLTAEEAATSPQRSVILQALGPRPEIQVDLTRQLLRRGDTLLLCSDGLSGVVGRAEIARTLSSTPDPAAACAALVELANEQGGPDNVTVVAAALEGEGLAPASPLDEVGYTPFPGGD